VSKVYRMSKALREELELLAAKANSGESHVVGDALERILGYPVGDDADDLPHNREVYGDENGESQ
jgi:hypothetical protein